MIMRIILQMKIILQILGFSFLSIYRRCKKNIRNKIMKDLLENNNYWNIIQMDL